MDGIGLGPVPANCRRRFVAMGAVRPLLVVELPPAFSPRRGCGTIAGSAARPATKPLCQGLPVAMEHGQGVSFLLGELVVHEGSSLAGVIPSSLPAHFWVHGRRGCCTYFVNRRSFVGTSFRRLAT